MQKTTVHEAEPSDFVDKQTRRKHVARWQLATLHSPSSAPAFDPLPCRLRWDLRLWSTAATAES